MKKTGDRKSHDTLPLTSPQSTFSPPILLKLSTFLHVNPRCHKILTSQELSTLLYNYPLHLKQPIHVIIIHFTSNNLSSLIMHLTTKCRLSKSLQSDSGFLFSIAPYTVPGFFTLFTIICRMPDSNPNCCGRSQVYQLTTHIPKAKKTIIYIQVLHVLFRYIVINSKENFFLNLVLRSRSRSRLKTGRLRNPVRTF